MTAITERGRRSTSAPPPNNRKGPKKSLDLVVLRRVAPGAMADWTFLQQQLARIEADIATIRARERQLEAMHEVLKNEYWELAEIRGALEKTAHLYRDVRRRSEPMAALREVQHLLGNARQVRGKPKLAVVAPRPPKQPKPKRTETKQARAWAIIHSFLVTCNEATAHRLDIANRVLEGGVLADEARAFKVFDNMLMFYRNRGLLTTDYKGNHTLTQLGKTVKDERDFVGITKAVEP
jgi:hypothetical protein